MKMHDFVYRLLLGKLFNPYFMCKLSIAKAKGNGRKIA